MLLVKNEDKVKSKSINKFIKSITNLEDKFNICKYINKVLHLRTFKTPILYKKLKYFL
jgi:hypothetical protein